MKVKVKGYNDLVTLVGNLLEVPAGSVLLCEGEWKVDKRAVDFCRVCRTHSKALQKEHHILDVLLLTNA